MLKKMLEHELIKKVEHFAKENCEMDDIHGFPHVERVCKISIKIGRELDANMLVLRISALLHDIGRIKEKNALNGINHAEISGKMAFSFLKTIDHDLSDEELENILHSIRAHSFSNNITPITLEAKILSDADKLDALGAIGLYRTIGFTLQREGDVRKVIDHLANKILKLKNRLFLESSRRIAIERHRIVEMFYNNLLSEI